MKNIGVSGRLKAITSAEGERLAVSALGFLAADSEKLSRFLALSGLGPHNLRAAAADPRFLSGVLDYLLADERLLQAFAADQSCVPETVAAARRAMEDAPPDPP
jgi:hypothetical protein